MRVTETTSLGVSTVTPSDEGSVVGVVGADIAPVLFMFLTSRRTQGGDDGFGLAEALVASGLLVTLSVGLAHLTAMTSRAVQRAAADSTGLLLAVQKMEQLRSLAWTHGRVWSVAGTGVVSDVTTNLATNPPTPNGRGLRVAPVGALARNTPGYVDYLDRAGRWIGSGARPPAGTFFVRRWSVRRVGAARDDRLVLQVLVMPLGVAIQTVGLIPGPNVPGVVWLATLRARR